MEDVTYSSSLVEANVPKDNGTKEQTIDELLHELENNPIHYDAPIDTAAEPQSDTNKKTPDADNDNKNPSHKAVAKAFLAAIGEGQHVLCAYISQDKHGEVNFRFTPEQKEVILPLLAIEIERNGGVLPNWALLAFSMAVVVGGNIAKAVDIRKEKQKTIDTPKNEKPTTKK